MTDQAPDQQTQAAAQLPEVVALDALVETFGKITALGHRPTDPEDAAHRRGLERLAARLAGFAVVVVLGVSGWIALDTQNRYSDTMQQTAGGALLSLTSGLIGFAVKR